jgi:hypothetical protein
MSEIKNNLISFEIFLSNFAARYAFLSFQVGIEHIRFRIALIFKLYLDLKFRPELFPIKIQI